MKKKLVAVDTIIRGKETIAAGKPFEAEADEAARLVKVGAATEAPVEPVVQAQAQQQASGEKQQGAGDGKQGGAK